MAEEIVPPSLAPNTITIGAFIGMIFAFLITLYHSPTLTEDLPTWVIIFV